MLLVGPEQFKKLDDYVKKIVDGASDVYPIDRAAVKGRVDALYKLRASRGDGNVKIIWCLVSHIFGSMQ